jgi:hypothetical protein
MEYSDSIKQRIKQYSYHNMLHACLLMLSMIMATLMLSACGGGGSGGTDSNSGEVLIGLTDAKGDFATYTVDVLSLTLTKKNGQTVETLPLNTRVDFAQYTDLTEFLTAATVPNGVYVKGTMTLDYSNADIQVEDADGNAIPVNNIVDSNGDPLTQLVASVNLEGRNSLPIAPGIPASLTLDFDLKKSNSVAFDVDDIPTVTVTPLLVAEVNGKAPKRHRVRGPLKNVEVDKNRFSVFIHPFRNRISTGARHFGTINIHVNDDTVYEIDGDGFTGTEGLSELALQPEKTAIIARGVIQFAPRRFIAHEVYAGASVPGGTLDVVRGSVIARTGDILTVRGATLIRNDGKVQFRDDVAVLLDSSTIVRKQLSADPFTIGDISVGQRITVFGMASSDETGAMTLDAANGYARMGVSVVRGSVQNVAFIPENPPQFPFVLDVVTINGRNVALYDFTGTGSDTANDAQADFYEIDSGTLNTSGINPGTKVAVGGFVTPFGTAPADFSAQTIVTPAVSIGRVPPVDDSENAVEEPAS